MNARGLELANVATGYRDRPVLAGVTLGDLPPGTLAAVIGPNAVGKSTLLKAIAGLRRYSGQITLDGTDLARLDLAERLRRVGYLPQHLPPPNALLAYEVVLAALRAGGSGSIKSGFIKGSSGESGLATRDAEATIERVFAQLGIRDLALRPLSELSGGQRQMIGLAQVLARAPRLLLLDEPTSALDLNWQLALLDAVRDTAARDGAVALIAIHDINLALRFCTRLVVLGQGGVFASGAPDAVLTPDLLRSAYGVAARIERCSQGHPIVLVDGRAPRITPES